MTTYGTSSAASCKRKPCVKCHWRREEDDLLTLLVRVHGPGKWDQIAAHIPGRTGKSCRIRWINQLNPSVDKTPFSAQENRRLLELHREYGNKWSTIVNYFPGRTDNQVKNQYHILSGSRYMRALASASSSRADPHGPLNEGLPPNQSIPMYKVGPLLTEMGPSLVGGSSSVYGQGENLTRVGPHSSNSSILDPSNGDGAYPNQRISRTNSLVSDASSSEADEVCPAPQPQQGTGFRNHQFIDFLGVGSSE